MNAKASTVPVSRVALVQRINRLLAKDDEQLRATRGGKAQEQLGDFYTVDLRLNAIIHQHINLEEFGREIGALKAFEHLEG